VVFAALVLALWSTTPAAGAGDDYQRTAREAAKWIRSTAVGDAKVWPTNTADAKSVNTSLYNGVSGTVLFFLELSHATGDRSYLDDARRGADYLVGALEKEKGTGLYEGVAGIGFALTETYKATGEEKYRAAARRAVEILGRRAKEAGKGVEWNEVTDVISGGAGTGLFLLYAARELKDGGARALAERAGDRLVELSRPAPGGLKWAVSPRFPRLMPNFSHGTAGVCYFLATLHGETRKKEYLDAALAGARYLQGVAKTDGGGCLIFHDEPGGEDLYYLGWCHGPAGTARLFYRLYRVTGERVWLDWTEKCARGVLQSGIPEKRTPGFWNNVGPCCGSAGVAEFFLGLHEVTREQRYLAFSRELTRDVLRRATADEKGVRWVQAEHRVKPDLLQAQTGYMQGAAGVGMWLLRLDRFERGKKPAIRLPDSPF
jgi:lantibiotic modifying enzyme